MKKIVIKMKSFKKLINQDLLQLALIISLLKVGPNSYFDLNRSNGQDSGGGVLLGEAWQPTLPSYPLKDPSSLLARYQEDILEELNTLGTYNRFSLYGDIPVQLSAYLVDTDSPCNDCEQTDSDSGISDTENVGSPFSSGSDNAPGSPGSEHTPESPDSEHAFESSSSEQAPESLGLMHAPDLDGSHVGKPDVEECLMRGDVNSAPGAGGMFPEFYEDDLMDLDDGAGVEYGPEIPPELVQAGIPELEDHGAIQYELLHMDEQLMNLDYNIEDLDEAFIKMDEEIALTFSEDDLMNQDQDMEGFDEEIFDRPNPFDDWERESFSAIPDLLQLDAINEEPLFPVQEEIRERENLDDLGLNLGVAELDEFDLNMLNSPRTTELLSEDEILRNDVMFSRARDSGDLNSELVEDEEKKAHESAGAHQQVYTPETFIRGKSEEEEDILDISLEDALEGVSEESLENIDVALEQEEGILEGDIIAQVMKESGILEAEVKLETEPESIHTEHLKVEDIKVEDEDEDEVLHEEILDVVSSEEFQTSLQLSGGACAQVDLDTLYGRRSGKGVPEFTLSYQPFFSWDGFNNDHGSYTAAKLEPGVKLESELEKESGDGGLRSGLGGRRRNESESSGYYSSEDSRCTRDEKLAAKVGLPYTVRELINCPVDRFNMILADSTLSPHQVKICKDIRRRGKNKVAAQNCRKRKLETIEELQVQVESVRRRREQLLRERDRLEQERRRWSSKLIRMEQFVMSGLGKDIAEFTIQVVDDRVELTSRLGGRGRGGRSRN